MSTKSKFTDGSPESSGNTPSKFVDETPATWGSSRRAKRRSFPAMARSVGVKLKESRAVKFFRSSAVIVLAGSTILLSTVSFTMSNRKEHHDFENQVRYQCFYVVGIACEI